MTGRFPAADASRVMPVGSLVTMRSPGPGQQHSGCVDRITRAGLAEQGSGQAVIVGADRADIDGAQQLGEVGLAAVAVPPDLGDHRGVRAQVYAVALGRAIIARSPRSAAASAPASRTSALCR